MNIEEIHLHAVLTDKPTPKRGLKNACCYCHKKFSARRSWKHHEQYCSQNPKAIREFPCGICSTVFGRKEALRRHVAKGSCIGPSNKVSRHFCTYENCNARFWHKTGLINHLKVNRTVFISVSLS